MFQPQMISSEQTQERYAIYKFLIGYNNACKFNSHKFQYELTIKFILIKRFEVKKDFADSLHGPHSYKTICLSQTLFIAMRVNN